MALYNSDEQAVVPFLWGVSTAAHQIEGGNHNDWSLWEKNNAARLSSQASPDNNYGNGKLSASVWQYVAKLASVPDNYISGTAANSWERWRDDIDLVSKLGLNAYRYSIEWSRIQPTRDSVDQAALDRYVQMTEYCLASGITPVITLHHFTNPIWFADLGGWSKKEAVGLFNAYVELVVNALPKNKAIYYTVINEPNVYVLLSWLLGHWPPAKHNYLAYRRAKKHLLAAHKNAYGFIKQADPSAMVSSSVNLMDFDPKPNRFKIINNFLAYLGRKLLNDWFIDRSLATMDFLAINHYMHCVVDMGYYKNDATEPKSDLGWYLDPQSLSRVVNYAGKFHKPIIITEHGIADAKDDKRVWFMSESLAALEKAIQKGADVRGYLHWSLLDNFEWDKGYWPKFGLYAVNADNQKRSKKPSADIFKAIVAESKRRR